MVLGTTWSQFLHLVSASCSFSSGSVYGSCRITYSWAISILLCSLEIGFKVNAGC